jgi:enoyl-CoA hydratase/carnithine racemase
MDDHGIDQSLADGVATLSWSRPPHNFIDAAFVEALAIRLEGLDTDDRCRTIILRADGKHFCAGADLAGRLGAAVDAAAPPATAAHIYEQARRIADTRKPMIAAVQGAAVGAGLGLALLADFRVASPSSRFSANFVMQGLHPGFGLTVTLPALIGLQQASWMMYSGYRVPGTQALAMGLIDRLCDDHAILGEANAMARALAAAAPLALEATRATLRAGLADAFAAATECELRQQDRLKRTDDYREGVLAMRDRRQPLFHGR